MRKGRESRFSNQKEKKKWEFPNIRQTERRESPLKSEKKKEGLGVHSFCPRGGEEGIPFGGKKKRGDGSLFTNKGGRKKEKKRGQVFPHPEKGGGEEKWFRLMLGIGKKKKN